MIEQPTVVGSACALFHCETCNHRLRGRCPGCAEGNAVRVADGEQSCGIYQCVVSKGLASCEECSASVCQFPRTLEMVCPIRSHFEKKRCYARKLAEHFLGKQASHRRPSGSRISERTIMRLRWYLFALDDFLAHSIPRVSSEDISRKVGVKDWLIRRDLNQFGDFGRPSIGYDAAFLRSRLAAILHLDTSKDVVWVGASRLADDESLIRRFAGHNFQIVAVLDPDPSQAPPRIGDVRVLPLSNASRIIQELGIEGAVLAVGEEDAQSVADLLISAGVRGILNLSSAVVLAPPGVCVRNVDIVAELFALSYYCHELHQPD